MRRMLSAAAQALSPVPRRRHPLPAPRAAPPPGFILPRGQFQGRGGVLRRLDATSAAIARDLAELPTASAVLAHHSENMEDYDLVAASTALGRVAGGAGRGDAALRSAAAPWKRGAVPAAEVDTLARHSVSLLREALKGAADAGASGRADGAPALAPRTLAHTLHSLSRLGRLPSSLLHEVSHALLHTGLCGGPQALAPADVAQLAFAFSRANVRAPSLFSRLEARMLLGQEGSAAAPGGAARPPARPLEAFRDAELVGILLSFATLRTSAPGLFQAAAARLCARKDQRDTLTPALLSTAVLSFVRAMDVPAAPAHAQPRLLPPPPSAHPPPPTPPPPPPPPPPQAHSALHALQHLAARIEHTARHYRVPTVQTHAFTPQGIAVTAWGYARAARRAAAAAAAAPAAQAPSSPAHLRLDSTVSVLCALNSAFLHPQTLATAQPLHLAMVLAATADVHELVQEAEAGEAGRAAGKRAAGQGSETGSVSCRALLTRLATGELCLGVARAAVRLLDPGSAGAQAGAAAAQAALLARSVLVPAETAEVQEGSDLPQSWSSRRRAGGGVSSSSSSSAAAGGSLEEDEMALQELLAQAAEEQRAGSRITGDNVITLGESWGAAEGQGGGAAAADTARRYSPLQYQRGVALATPFSMHDVSSLAHSMARVGYSAQGRDGGSSLAEFWGKLAARACRGKDGDAESGAGAGTNPRAARALLVEDGMASLSAHDAANLALGFALGAPRQHAGRVLEALSRAFCAQDLRYSSEERQGGHSRKGDAHMSISAAPPPPSLPSSPASASASASLSDTIPSFDDTPTWQEAEMEALRRSAGFRRAPTFPVHRLRGEPSATSRDVRESGGRAEAWGSAADAGTGDVNTLALQAPKVHTGTRTSWAARLLHKSSPDDLVRLASALALGYPAAAQQQENAGARGQRAAAAAPILHLFKHWRMLAGPLAAAPTASPAAEALQRGLSAGALLPAASTAAPLLAHTLRSVCARLGEVTESGNETARAAHALPLLAGRDYAHYHARAAATAAPAPVDRLALPWPPEALVRDTARSVARSLEGGSGTARGVAAAAAAAAAAGKEAATPARSGAEKFRRPAPLQHPMSTYAALARPLAHLVQRSLHRASAPANTSVEAALAASKHARHALVRLGEAAVARAGGGDGGAGAAPQRAPRKDAGRAAAVTALGRSLCEALEPLLAYQALRGAQGEECEELKALRATTLQLKLTFQ